MSCVIVISSESEDETPKMAESQIKPKLTENAESTNKVEVTKELENHKNGFKNEENAEKTNDTGIDSDVIIEQGDRSKSIKLLEEFIGLCMLLIKKENRPIEIVQFLRRRYSKATSDYKNSEEFCAVVERYIADLRRGVKREFVYINDLATHLNKHAIKQIKRPTNGVINSSSKKKAKLSEMPTTAETTEPTVDCNMPGTSSGQDGGSSTHDEDARSNVMMEQNDQRIQRYENLMKRISDEIKRYQAHELTLDEMTEENSVYVEESKLKDRFMKIFNKVCALKKVNSATGRAIERKITVASCRFPEINRKVEQYVN
uniref:Daxx N-terminal Rassf1C-interacting domain-containing protein n=1 Tax=Ciona savignyi TaxID=51511 RepID=H2YCA2_CIOSA